MIQRVLATYVVYEGTITANAIVSIDEKGEIIVEPFRSEIAFTEFHNAVALCGRYEASQFLIDETLSLNEIANVLQQQSQKISENINLEPQILLFGE